MTVDVVEASNISFISPDTRLSASLILVHGALNYINCIRGMKIIKNNDRQQNYTYVTFNSRLGLAS